MGRPLQVLILDDSAADAERMANTLREAGLELTWERAETEADCRARLSRPPDLILATDALPQCPALRALQLLKEQGLAIPLLVMAEQGEAGQIVAVIKAGAHDYILKSQLERLAPAVTELFQEHAMPPPPAAAPQGRESQYRQFFELESDALFLIDSATGRILEANEAATILYGYTHAELLTLCDVDLSAEPAQTRAVPQEQRFHRKHDGTVFPVEITGRQFIWQGHPAQIAAIRDVTHRLRTEEALRATNEQLTLILNGVPALIAYVDAEERYRFVNRPYAEWYGHAPADMIGKRIQETLRDEVYQRAAPYYRAALSGQSVAFENVAYDKNGHRRVVSVSFTPHVDANGHVAGFLGLIHDITERRQAEEIARRTSEQFSTLYAAGQELSQTLDPEEIYAVLHRFTRQTIACDRFYISTYDPETRLITCAAAWEGNLRLDVNRFSPLPLDRAGQEFQTLVIQSGQALLFSDEEIQLSATWSTGGCATDAARPPEQPARDGRSALLIPLKTEGVLTGIIQVFSAKSNAYTLDQLHLLESFALHVASALHNARLYQQAQVELAERQRAEAALRESEARFRSIIESSADGISVTDNSGTVVEWNAAEETITGLPRAAVVGRKIWEIQHSLVPEERRTPGMLTRLKTLNSQLLAQDPATWENQLWEVDFQHPDGTRRIIQSLTFMIPTEGGFNLGSITRDVTERHQSEQALQRRVAQLALLSEVSRRIAAELEPENLLAQAVELIQRTFGYHHVAVYLLEPTQGLVLKQAKTGDITDILPPDHRLRLGQGLVGWVGQHGEPVIANDVTAEPRYINFYPDRLPTRAELAVPIQLGRTTLGVLDVQSPQRDAFDETDVQVLKTLADQIAVARQNAELYEETRRRLEREERLNELAHALGGEMELAALLNRFLPAAVALTGADCAAISLLEPDGFVYHDYYQYNLPVPLLPSRRPVGEGVVGQVIRDRVPLQVDEYCEHPAALPAWVQAGVHSLLSVPLLVGNEAVGALGLFTVGEARPFGPEATASAKAAARLVAVAIQRARLFEQERKQRQLAEALAKAAAAISSSLELDKVLDQILEQTLQVVRGEACDVMLVQEQLARIARWRGHENFETRAIIATFVFHIATTPNLHQMTETGAPIVIPNVSAYPGWIPLPGTEWLRSYVGAPIKVGGLVVGFLNVNSSRPEQFTADDAQRLQAFANQAATVIENAGLFQELRRYAEQLEQRVQERTAQLQSQVARAEAILSSVSDGIAVTDRDGTVLQANPVMQTWLTRLSPPEAEQLIKVMRDLAQRVTAHPETTLELPGLDLQLRAAPIAAPGVTEAAAVIAAHDVSELKTLDRMKSRFVSNVSHELRTPITTIRLYATLLRRGHREKAEQYLAALEEETKRLAQLVEDVLQISRIDAGRLELKLRPTPLNSLVEAVVNSHTTLATAGGLTLTYYPQSPSPWTAVDSDKIIQVFNNLTENAIRYTRPGGSVTVSTGVAAQQGREWATITIVDTGIGIPPPELPHIFERFYRGDEPRQLQLPGSGLGLAIVKEIVELHGGHITVESAVGQGCTFIVWLPLTQPPGLP